MVVEGPSPSMQAPPPASPSKEAYAAGSTGAPFTYLLMPATGIFAGDTDVLLVIRAFWTRPSVSLLHVLRKAERRNSARTGILNCFMSSSLAMHNVDGYLMSILPEDLLWVF